MAIKAANFALVPTDLIDGVVIYGRWLEENGFRVFCEPFDLEYPNTPVFKGTRNGEEHYVEVASAINLSRTEEWVKYGKAASNDTRIIVAVANGKPISPEHLTKIQKWGVGVHLIDVSGVNIMCSPHDLSLNVDFPRIDRKMIKKLGRSKELLEQGNWKEAFEDACIAFETDVRSYLTKEFNNNRIMFMDNQGKPVGINQSQIDKATLGKLGYMFSVISNPNQMQSRIAVAIERINDDRVTVAHYKHKSGRRLKTLRKKVGKDLQIIVNALEMLAGSS